MKDTPLGTIHILNKEDIFKYTLQSIEEAAPKDPNTLGSIGLTGGSTPKAFYRWVIENKALSLDLAKRFIWTTSDERCVPIKSDDSNFGNAERMLLDPLGLPKENKLPWPTHCEPLMAVKLFIQTWNERLNPDACFDLCFLGMGDDCHIASMFPNSSLINSGIKDHFSHVNIPMKGDRLTITEAGLEKTKRIIVIATGRSKAQALRLVLNEDYNPLLKPAQILKQFADKVTWLLDEEAASTVEDYL